MKARGGASRPRTKIVASKITGRITEWKGTFGWIAPDKPIAHQDAVKHQGKIYLSQLDVESEISGVGAAVSFYVYADGSGLGAMNCGPVGAPVARSISKPQHGASSAASALAQSTGGGRQPAGPRKRISNVPISGILKQWKGAFGWIVPIENVRHPSFRGQIYLHAKDLGGIKPAQLHDGQQVTFTVYEDIQGLGADNIKIDGVESFPPRPTSKPTSSLGLSGASGSLAGGARGLGSMAPRALPPAGAAAAAALLSRAAVPPMANLARERITVVETTGEVMDWKGSFGWLKSHDTIDHVAATKRSGKIYVSRKDLVGVPTLHLGQIVQFHVFADASGLGAEECSPF
eukprot:TRINITY_DN50720_c0_g1_i1.p1 TRINITY_DN50720_c0_g1~~TRINITY_DN50720_c0_g1_i1.p1  ORF type:complete len:346 (-),score=52.35 TRINITY_DN50720_c0_g1_i1:172-1209(-)